MSTIIKYYHGQEVKIDTDANTWFTVIGTIFNTSGWQYHWEPKYGERGVGLNDDLILLASAHEAKLHVTIEELGKVYEVQARDWLNFSRSTSSIYTDKSGVRIYVYPIWAMQEVGTTKQMRLGGFEQK